MSTVTTTDSPAELDAIRTARSFHGEKRSVTQRRREIMMGPVVHGFAGFRLAFRDTDASILDWLASAAQYWRWNFLGYAADKPADHPPP